jgi:hypothetical protein
MALVSPSRWPDPFENLIAMTGITYTGEVPFRQEFFDKSRRQVFAQCWTLAAESDAMWRIYSTVDKDAGSDTNIARESEGVRVRTTARKLFSALWEWCPTPTAKECCFLGRVQYSPEHAVMQQLANIVGAEGIGAFSGGRGHAMALLTKRDAFAHEQEVRLVYVEPDNTMHDVAGDPLRFMHVEPSDLFEELTLDPRLGAADVADRITELREYGYSGLLNKSPLYQRVLLEIYL